VTFATTGPSALMSILLLALTSLYKKNFFCARFHLINRLPAAKNNESRITRRNATAQSLQSCTEHSINVDLVRQSL
jgi:hypothetical protein